MLEELYKLIDAGWDITINNVARRMDVGNGREFVVRVCWIASIDTENKSFDVHCKWEGFASAKEAIQDLYNSLNEL